MEVIAYTDGSTSKNPGPGGYGVVLLHSQRRFDIGHFIGDECTNNIAELSGIQRAVLEAQRLCSEGDRLVIVSDSQYAIGTQTQGWRITANWDLVMDMRSQALALRRKGVEVEYRWVKGHSKDRYNDAADRLAKMAVQIRRSWCAEIQADGDDRYG